MLPIGSTETTTALVTCIYIHMPSSFVQTVLVVAKPALANGRLGYYCLTALLESIISWLHGVQLQLGLGLKARCPT